MKQSQLIQLNDGGILMPDGGVARGTYFASHNEGPWEPIFNSLTKEYLTYLLNSGMRGSPAALTSWYMTLFGVGQNPTDDWTAASFAALDAENESTAEGYVNPTRPVWTPGVAVDGLIANSADPVRFTFATASSVNIGGIAILSSDVRGGSAGVLASAANLNNSRQFEDGDTYDVVYRLRLEAQ